MLCKVVYFLVVTENVESFWDANHQQTTWSLAMGVKVNGPERMNRPGSQFGVVVGGVVTTIVVTVLRRLKGQHRSLGDDEVLRWFVLDRSLRA